MQETKTTVRASTLSNGRSLAAYHEDFDRKWASAWGRTLTYAQMHANRVVQSARIVLSHPDIWGKVASGFVNAARGRKRLLRSLEIAVTYRCNARCEQCSCRRDHDPVREKTELLTLPELQRVIDEAVDMGAFQFCINGGEPMLEEERVFALLDYIKTRHKGYVHLCTNGTLLDDDKVARLAEHHLDSVEMGFDSAFEDVHDANRVRGGYRKVFHNIEAFRKRGVGVVLNTILTNQKVRSDDMLFTMDLAEKHGCMLQVTPCCLTGALRGRMDMMLTERARFYFYWFLAQSTNNRSDLYSSLTRIKCPAGREKLGLQPYGDVVSCPLIQIRYGNVREKGLAAIQQDILADSYYGLDGSHGCLPAMSETFIRERLSGDR